MPTTYVQKQVSAQKSDATTAASVFDSSAQSESLQRKADMANNAAAQRAEAPRPNNTGMPDNLKAGIKVFRDSRWTMCVCITTVLNLRRCRRLRTHKGRTFMLPPVKKNASRTKRGMSLSKWLAEFRQPQILTACQ